MSVLLGCRGVRSGHYLFLIAMDCQDCVMDAHWIWIVGFLIPVLVNTAKYQTYAAGFGVHNKQ